MAESMIDTSRIEAMVAQLRAVAARAHGDVSPVDTVTESEKPVQRVDFASVFKNSLDQVNEAQEKAQQLSEGFSMGDDNINLSDVMISMQKANISFQTSLQVRNKLVSAYRDIMTMQV
ncbi:flagellar hook-basal body complex protein FliE [Herbaspirillum sp. Sphag1AN]|uniref:flagellar hook-basal body complex protein FliE n=1 Tax=unclassified Herbaspirillum TaxID=2624150 RepID=UPI00160D929D|nr:MULTISPECIES: flagellar hook-basal body complex protein FliE [unclassified Herbaspirillum]MBB3211012.1 flagellar hook-basal body complex protein FliE [Herbaspirillum sp. Sphag1AN]MBB3244641.1 flagellar hook-basal body complex protein FliE [Herbaspirillum sp. Sphag64]